MTDAQQRAAAKKFAADWKGKGYETCNFSAFHVYDMERPGGEPEEILLENLPMEYYRLSFLTDSGNEKIKREMEVSIAAGAIVGLLYDAFAKKYVIEARYPEYKDEIAAGLTNEICEEFIKGTEEMLCWIKEQL
jgi:hypothetical protein